MASAREFILETREEPLLRMGTYSMKVRFPVLELERGRLAIENTLSNYETACGLLKRLVITSHCTLLADDLKVALNNSRGINEFVKGFFPSRKSRGFITAIGGWTQTIE